MYKNTTKPVLQLLEVFYLAHIVKFWRGSSAPKATPKSAPAEEKPLIYHQKY